jgi:hypothetical protein
VYKSLLFRQLQDFAAVYGLASMVEFDVDWARRFRASWPNKHFGTKETGGSSSLLSFRTRKWLDPDESGESAEAAEDH